MTKKQTDTKNAIERQTQKMPETKNDKETDKTQKMPQKETQKIP